VLELPPKIPYYSSLFVVANARKEDIGRDMLAYSIGKVKELLEKGDVGRAKYMLRFLSGLSRIVDQDGFMSVINEIVSKIEGQKPNVIDSKGGLILGTNR
jgi:hypothetical protein